VGFWKKKLGCVAGFRRRRKLVIVAVRVVEQACVFRTCVIAHLYRNNQILAVPNFRDPDFLMSGADVQIITNQLFLTPTGFLLFRVACVEIFVH
jgi:hypothetical protein